MRAAFSMYSLPSRASVLAEGSARVSSTCHGFTNGEHDELQGPVNICSPNPLPQREFARVLSKAVGARFAIPAPEWLVEIGTWLKRTESELVLKSRRVVPTRLLEAGFSFEFPQWEDAARDLASSLR
jgi:NAD dependent epimerase/dehydratase family enzyme